MSMRNPIAVCLLVVCLLATSTFSQQTSSATLTDYGSFVSYAARARANTLSELKEADLATWKRTVVYSFGAAEGFLLDRINPGWKEQYFVQPLSTDTYFEAKP